METQECRRHVTGLGLHFCGGSVGKVVASLRDFTEGWDVFFATNIASLRDFSFCLAASLLRAFRFA
ncbi:hypothetical protein LXM25_12390 [Dyadobacter sp. LJ53]|uniref:hypothetical protein n=1 Tax=Dyadobacter chenwenxiniae TaxID=2906456 RepID=UPI001F16C287|nr:hypothetical protein [Dyadobacter chenwenxiniae]MCF0050863.1 hypothetical protein [Dyadobacter chenwenxiniae]